MKDSLRELIKIPKSDQIPYFDKPPALGGKLSYLSPEEFKKKFGCEYSESLWGSESFVSKISQEELYEFYGVERQVFFNPNDLKAKLQHFYKNGFAKLSIGFIDKSVGHGVFALKHIPKGTPLCIYAGVLVSELGVDDNYVQTIDDKRFISAKEKRGMSGFMQHLPVDCDKYVTSINEGLDKQYANAIERKFLSVKDIEAEKMNAALQTRNENPDFAQIKFKNLTSTAEMATSNACIVRDVIGNVCFFVMISIFDIEQYDQVGNSYGFSFWANRRLAPELLFKTGKIIPHTEYERGLFARCYLFKSLLNVFPYKKESLFWPCIAEGDYSKALRIACTDQNHENSLKLASVLLEYKNEFAINLDEQPGDKKLGAIHLAGRVGNRKLVDLLAKHGASTSLRDAEDKTVNVYLDEYKANKVKVENKAFVAARVRQDKLKVKKASDDKADIVQKNNASPFFGIFTKK